MNRKIARYTMWLFIPAVWAFGLTAAESVHWSYSGKDGPENWGKLSPEFASCSKGMNQSPVNIANAVEGNLPALTFAYSANGDEVLYNGHAVQVNFGSGNSMRVGERNFSLAQVHFHAPSENTIDGSSYPMEGHLVHADAAGNLAVVAIMFTVGAQNSELEKAWSVMSAEKNVTNRLSSALNAQGLLPATLDYYRFNGSLTTPPCSEGVNWFVLKSPVTISKSQLTRFKNVLHEENNRPVQPINARVIVG